MYQDEAANGQGCIHLPFTLPGFLALKGFSSFLGLKAQGLLAQLQNWTWANPGYASCF